MWLRKDKAPKSALDLRLETPRLIVRPATMDDFRQWADMRWKNLAYLKPFEPTWPQKCLSEQFFLRRVKRLCDDWLADCTYAFLICDRDDGRLLGGININNVVRGAGQHASLGYWIDEESQGRGYMTEAGRAVLDYAFSTLCLARINAACLVHNDRSRNLLLRLGFTEEGFAKAYLQIDGVRQDHLLFGLNAVDFLGAARYAGNHFGADAQNGE